MSSVPRCPDNLCSSCCFLLCIPSLFTLCVPFCCPEHLEQESNRKVKKPLFVSCLETLLRNTPGALRNNLFPSSPTSKKSDSFRLVMLGVHVLNQCCQAIVIYSSKATLRKPEDPWAGHTYIPLAFGL